MTDTTNESNFISRSDFMKKAGLSIGGILLLNCLQACSDEAEVTPVSPTNPSAGSSRLDFTLDLNQNTNSALRSTNGFLVVNSQRVIVVRLANNEFIAVQSNCTHQGVTVAFRANQNDFYCSAHGSAFQLDGTVKNGPAGSALRQYKYSFDVTSNILRIFE